MSQADLMGGAIAFAISALAVLAPPAQALERMLDNGSVRALSEQERSELDDPFFRLVLAKDPVPQTLESVMQAIQPDAEQRRIFVVSEELARTSQQAPARRRTAIGFEGTTASILLKPNVMLSVSIEPDRFLTPEIEAWGWDETNGRYNYYSREEEGGSARWFFHGSSADLGKPAAERGRCLSCHPSGAPVMKELFFPWVNWHGPRFQAAYLQSSSPGHWPIADFPLFGKSLSMADKLEEDFIVPSITRFNQARLRQGVEAVGEDRRVLRSRELLAPLFRTTEFNLITSTVQSGMHPLSSNLPGRPATPVRIPRSFFLNADLIAGNAAAALAGLGIARAEGFGTAGELVVQPEEYAKLVHESTQRLGNMGGDAAFAWLTPEPSFVDNHLVDLLLREGAVMPHFVAAVLSVDLRRPIYSSAREELLEFIPDSYMYRPTGETDSATTPVEDNLTKAVLAALEARGDLSSSAALFRDRLKAADAVELLGADVAAYLDDVTTRARPSEPSVRAAHLTNLHNCLIERRKLAKDRFGVIIESRFLLPVDGSRPCRL